MIVLHDFLQPLITVPLIRSRQNVNEPGKPYATYFITGRTTPNHNIVYDVDEFGIRDTSQLVNYKAQLDFYGANAFDLAEAAHAQLGLETVVERGLSVGISVNGRGEVQDLTELLVNTQYQQRAMFELSFYSPVITPEDVSYIAEVEISDQSEPVAVVGNFTVKYIP